MLRVRPEEDADHERVRAVHEAAFGRPDEARLVEALRASAHPAISLVAELDGRVAGHVFFSPVGLEPSSPGFAAAALGPLAVGPPAQGRGIGSALVRAGLERCPGQGWRAVFLLGNPAYYERFGFAPAGPLGLLYGSEALERAFQVRELAPGALAGCRGRVRYHEAFAGL